MERHATFPDGENFERVRKIITGVVKQHLAQSPAQNHAEHAIEQQVIEQLGVDLWLVQCGDTLASQPQESHETGQVHQPIPMDAKGAEMDRDRVELWVSEHGARMYHKAKYKKYSRR